jgi:hypothetical protein
MRNLSDLLIRNSENLLRQLKSCLWEAAFYGGNNRARTCDIMLVRHALSQLSYAPGIGDPKEV